MFEGRRRELKARAYGWLIRQPIVVRHDREPHAEQGGDNGGGLGNTLNIQLLVPAQEDLLILFSSCYCTASSTAIA